MNRLVRVTRHEEELHLGPESEQAVRQLPPAHSRQDYVGQKKMDRRRVLLARHERLAPIAGFEDAVPLPTEDAARDAAHLFVVLDEKDGLASFHAAYRRGNR